MKPAAIVIGVSSGGMSALRTLLPALPEGFDIPVVIVQHVGSNSGTFWIETLDGMCKVHVHEAEEKEKIEGGNVYLAPANYHLLIEMDRTFSLSVDERVNFARPSIDVLFESAAEAYGKELAGIILTGSNHDGSAGLKKIKEKGGITVAQNPDSAESGYMPASAIAVSPPDHILNLEQIIILLLQWAGNPG